VPRVLLFDHHDQLLGLWRREGRSGLRLVHIDAHCDLRGLVVDPSTSEAALVLPLAPRPSNFLAIAAAEGRVARVRWFHDRWGGRRHDTFTMLLLAELEYWPFRRHRDAWARARRFRFELCRGDLQAFDGLEAGEVLDIDWDHFFLRGKPRAVGEREVEAFLGRDFGRVPEETYLCHSPAYSSTDRASCARFAERLAERFGARLEELEPPPARRAPSGLHRGAPRRMARRAYASLRNPAVALQGGVFE
jgi:hypothetical protein